MSLFRANLHALMGALSPLTGDRATGMLRLYSATGTAEVPVGTYAFPVLGTTGPAQGQLDPARAVKPVATSSDGVYLVGTTGALVPVHSQLGGARQNMGSGTAFVFDPPVPGLTGSVVAPAGLAGGADPSGFGAVLDVVTLDGVRGPVLSLDLRRSAITRFPAIVVTWRECLPADGTTQPSTSRGTRLGRDALLYRVGYLLTVVCSRLDDGAMRRGEGLEILSSLCELLSDRTSADHEDLSAPSGVQIHRIWREVGDKEVYQRYAIYNVDLSCAVVIQRTDARSFADWLRTHLMVDVAVAADVPGGDLRLVDVLVDMRPTNLEVGGEQVQADGEDVVVE